MAVLHFTSVLGRLTVTDSKGSYVVRASSGGGKCTNNPKCEGISNLGPIPKGRYAVYRKDINNPGMLHDIARNCLYGDWGDWRVAIRSASGSPTPLGRDGFYIHGGRYPGSAGCIDIGGGILGNSVTDRVLKSLKETEVSELWVD
jgi:hypothetical protein